MGKVNFHLPPITGKVKFLSHPKTSVPPVFNQPLNINSCPHHRLARLLYGIFLAILFIMAIPVIILKAVTYSFIEDNRMMGFNFETTRKNGEPGEEVIMAALPERLYSVPAKLAIIAGAISLCIGAAHLGFVITDWKSGKRSQSYAFRRNVMFLHITNAILVLFALVSIYVTHKNTSHFRSGYVAFRASRMQDTTENQEPFFRYNVGTFDLETWACELQRVKGATIVREDYGRQCGIEIAGRAIMVPFVAAAWLVAGIGTWGFIGGGRRGPDGERIKTDELGLEMISPLNKDHVFVFITPLALPLYIFLDTLTLGFPSTASIVIHSAASKQGHETCPFERFLRIVRLHLLIINSPSSSRSSIFHQFAIRPLAVVKLDRRPVSRLIKFRLNH
ncbi:hypothetical protein DDE82_000186 [Stemphylium lycopersici]|uniref:Uncharacterized protein n=1 Tax=Stemphylium lycopersici TaxID=183478 RepID=A0A364N5V7_STELY|nr:hypothetical protein TW65_09248 [Stemphylium lycopersici]RAR12475.1 hypothetical protein DDE82_000186 [Stemphylium lycopersici]RAR12640.1 hypothetical protein DDE83_004037 [Stemphylium lycopersici]